MEPCEPRLLMAGDVLFALNAGGPTLTDATGQVWTADTGFFNGSAQSDTYDTDNAIDLSDPSIPDGTDVRLFQTERWDRSEGEELAYAFDLADGTYRLDVYFAEIYHGTQDPGDRVFDVEVEGQTALNNYDVVDAVGGYTGVVESFEVELDDGQLNLRFLRETQNPAVKAIRVVSVAEPDPVAPEVDVDGPTGDGAFAAEFTAGGGAVSIVAPDATLTDADSATLASLTVTLDATPDGAGEVLAADTSGTSIAASYDGGVLSLTGEASVADYRAVLGTVTYDNVAAEPTLGLRTASFVANDGALDSAAALAVVDVQPEPDPVAPVLDLNGAGAGTNASALFVGGGDAVALAPQATLTDADSSTLASLTVTLDAAPDGASEVLSADVVGTGLTAVYADGVLTVSGTATAAAYQAVLRSVAYANTADPLTEGPRAVSVVVNDGTLDSNAAAVAVDVALPEPPAESVVLYAVHPGAGFTDSSGQVWTPDDGFFNTDAESNNFTSPPAIDLSDPSLPEGTDERHFRSERWDPDSGEELTYSFDVEDGTYRIELYFADIYSGTQDPGDRVFDVEIEGQTVLDDFDIVDEVGGYTGVVKTFEVEVSDGQATVTFLHEVENPAIKAIRVSTVGPPVPDPVAPSVDLNGDATGTGFAAAFLAEAGPVSVVGSEAAIVDTDSPTLRSLTVTLTNPLDGASETLDVDTGGTGLLATFADGTLTLSGEASVADYQAVLRTVTYDNAEADPDLTPRTISFVANDGALDSAAAVATVTLTDDALPPVAPALDLNGGGAGTGFAATFAEELDAVAIVAPTATLTDTDSGTLESLTVTITNPADAPLEVLAADTTGTPIQADFADGTLTLTGTASVADYQAVLRTVTYENTQTDPDNQNRLITFVAHDGTLDSNLAVATVAVTDNGIPGPGLLAADVTEADLGDVQTGAVGRVTVALRNDGRPGDDDVVISAIDVVGPDADAFGVLLPDGLTEPIALAVGESLALTVYVQPTAAGALSAELRLTSDSLAGLVSVSLQAQAVEPVAVDFSGGFVAGLNAVTPTTLQWGPDGRLYVGTLDGLIHAYTLGRSGPAQYQVNASETLDLVQQIPNHNDLGEPEPDVNTRLITGILVAGTAENPIVYATSSDPRLTRVADSPTDTNSGVISRLERVDGVWEKVDLVRGLPRSTADHAPNGLQINPVTGELLVTIGGNTNAGAPADFFGDLPEYALSGAVVAFDLAAIEALPTQTDANGQDYKLNLPTLDDQDRPGVNDNNDPFGGNDGQNQARLVEDGPYRIFASGLRNAYDLVWTQYGRLYTADNGPNASIGSTPVPDGDGNPTNQQNEGGNTHPDALHLLTDGSYAGHPNPTRANTGNTFNNTNPQSPVYDGYTEPGDFRPSGQGDGALFTFDESTNGIDEYTASVFNNALNGDLLTVSINGELTRLKLSPDGTQVIDSEVLFSNAAGYPLDVTTVGDDHPFAGTIWVTDLFAGPGQAVRVFEPNVDNTGNGTPDDLDGDGFSNQDEIDNGTNPESAGDFPADNDNDFVSDLNDPNDDNDALDDLVDPFYIDAVNGSGVALPHALTFDNDDLNRGGLLDLGFTGLMTNGTTDPLDQFDTANLTAGSAAGVLTIDRVGDGTALGSTNTQENAFQFGVDVDDSSRAFVIHSQINSVFDNTTPAAGQRAGIYFGTGDQDNYISVFVEGDGTVNTVTEVGGSPTFGTGDILPPDSFINLNLYLTVDPDAGTVQAAYSLGADAPVIELASTEALPAAWLTGATRPAVGVISTTGGGESYAVTYDFIRVDYLEGDPGQTPFGGTPHQVGDVVQAEHFDEGGPGVAYFDTDTTNNGGSNARAGEQVDIEDTADAGGGQNVGWVGEDEYLEYTFDIARAGSYDVDFRVAQAHGSGGTFHLESDGVDVSGPITLPNTGGWQTWQTVTAGGVDLEAGEQTLRVVFDEKSSDSSVGNFNWFRINPLPDDPDPPADNQAPFGGTAATVDELIQAEHFDDGGAGVAYLDNDTENQGDSNLRSGEGVDLEATGDSGGGVNVGWVQAGEYLEYTVDIPAADTYSVDFRVALSSGSGGTFHLEADGVDVTGPVTLPNTGGWQNYQTVTVDGVQLDAGTRVLRVVFDAPSSGSDYVGNFNWFRINSPGIDPPDDALDLGDSNAFNWVDAAPIPGGDRFEAMTFTADNLVYVFGGFADDLTDKLEDGYVYDIRNDEWTRLADMPTAVNHLNVVYDEVLNQAWFVGGFKGEFPGEPTDEAWIYDVATDTWSAGPALPDELSSGATAIVGRELHYVGGFPTRDQDGVTDHYVLDLDNLGAGWSTSVAAPIGRGHASAAVVGDTLYIFGGQNHHRSSPTDLDEVYAFDTVTDTWSRKADLPFVWSHNEPSTFVANGRVFIAGGRNRPGDSSNRNQVNDFYAYDPELDVWIRLPELPDSLLAPFLTVVDDPNDGGGPCPGPQCGCASCQALFGGTGVTGGLNGTDATFAADFDDVWYTLEDLPADLGEVAGGVIDNVLYAVGDGNNGTYAYDFATGDWSNVNADRPVPAKDQLAQVIDGKLYVIGGVAVQQPGRPALDNVQIYDPQTNQWSAGADVPINVFAAQTALIDGKIYLNGGVVDGNQTTDNTYVYDPVADAWTQLADAPIGRNSAATGTDGEKMYIFGGRVGGDSPGNGFDTVLVYDPATDTWESSDDPGSDLAPLPQRRGGIVNAPFVGGEFYVIGGETDDDPSANDVGLYDRVDIYDPVTNTWREGAPMITARHGIYPVGYAGAIYIAGGGVVRGSSNSDVFEVYYADLI
ncbi:MAG: malectin domain-containing carbohydrate-binding protein [Planctomycetota bacterium]